MAQMTPQVSKLLEQSLSLSVEEQEALADSLISSLGERVDERLRAAWDDEIKKRITELDSGKAKPFPGPKFAIATWRSCLVPTRVVELNEEPAAEYDAAFDWYLQRSPDAAFKLDAELRRDQP